MGGLVILLGIEKCGDVAGLCLGHGHGGHGRPRLDGGGVANEGGKAVGRIGQHACNCAAVVESHQRWTCASARPVDPGDRVACAASRTPYRRFSAFRSGVVSTDARGWRLLAGSHAGQQRYHGTSRYETKTVQPAIP